MTDKIVVLEKDLDALKDFVLGNVLRYSEEDTVRFAKYLFDVIKERSQPYVETEETEETEAEKAKNLIGLIQEDISNGRNYHLYPYELQGLGRYVIYITTNSGYDPNLDRWQQKGTYQKIQLIKLLREQYNWGLKESKECVDEIERSVMQTTKTEVRRVFRTNMYYSACNLFDKVKAMNFSCLIYDRDEKAIKQQVQF